MKVLRTDDAGIRHHRQPLGVADGLDQPDQISVLHFLADPGIAQQAAVDRQGGMQRIQAGGHLHPLHLVDGVPVGEEEAGGLQRGAAIREGVLDDQVFAFLRVDEGRDIGMLGGNHGIQPLQAVRPQHGFHGSVRAGGDLVDHGPGEGNLRGIGHIGQEAGVLPALRQRRYGRPSACHRCGSSYPCSPWPWARARLIARVQQAGHLADDSSGASAGRRPNRPRAARPSRPGR